MPLRSSVRGSSGDDAVETGYDPDLVRALSHRTSDAIEALRAIRSDDPAAADAIRTIRLTRRNLEDLWMPALRRIVESDAMVSWADSRLDGQTPRPVYLAQGRRRSPPGPLSSYTDDELIDRISWVDRLESAGPDYAGTVDLDALAQELAVRVRSDRSFGRRVIALVPTTSVIGALTARADFPSWFLTGVITSMTQPRTLATIVDPDLYAASLSNALRAVTHDAQACLDLLVDETILRVIAGSRRLDPTAVSQFTVSAMDAAVRIDPTRITDGYEVLATLIALTNGPFDSGINLGLAVGVAGSMAGYLPTFAPVLNFEGESPTAVEIDGTLIELGTYDDLVGLFSVMLRDPAAQAAIAPAVSGYAIQTVHALGADVGSLSGVEYVADVADLLVDATDHGQVALMAEAAAEEGRRRRFANAIGFGLGVAAGVLGGSVAVRAVVTNAIRVGTEFVPSVNPAVMPDRLFGPTTYNLITMTALRNIVDGAGVRDEAGLDSIDGDDLDEISKRMARLDQETDVSRHMAGVRDLNRWIADNVPELDAFLTDVKSMPGMDALKE